MREDRHREHAEAFARLGPEVRAAVLDLAHAPSLPLDPSAYVWDEPTPGFRTALVREDPTRGLQAWIVWASPGAVYPAHRHNGDETTLVLQGACRDEHGSYSAGDIACMRAGSVHTVEFLPGEDCIAYLVACHGHDLLGA